MVSNMRNDSTGLASTRTIGVSDVKNVGRTAMEQVGEAKDLAVGQRDTVQIGDTMLVDVGTELRITVGKPSLLMKSNGEFTLKGVRLPGEFEDHIHHNARLIEDN